MDSVFASFRDFMGTGLLVIWYFVSLVYLWINEKRKTVRILFVYMPALVLLVYFNPLFARLVHRLADNEIYYRVLWLFPVTLVIAYTCVCIYGKIAHGWKADLFALCAGGLIMISGSFIYGSPLFSVAENKYHVPDSVVNICDAIHVPGREVMAAFPLELVQYVRQYDPLVCMPYGREVTVERWHYYSAFRNVMAEEVIDMEQLADQSRQSACHYCILHRDQKLKGSPEDYGWTVFYETDGYIIYRDPRTELIIPEAAD